MDWDTAERLAATEVEGVTKDDAHKIICAFLTEIVDCSACNGTGKVTFNRDVYLPARKGATRTEPIDAGTEMACPRCGGSEDAEAAGHDPEYFAWHCIRDVAERECRGAKDGTDEQKHRSHANCGFRVIIPPNVVQEGETDPPG